MWALLPVKDFMQAKKRLAPVLSVDERRKLVSCMLEDMLMVLSSHAQLDGVLVLSEDPQAGLLAERYNVTHLAETRFDANGLNEVLQAAIEYLAEQGIVEVMVVPGDLPLIDENEVSQLLTTHNRFKSRTVTLVPDRRGEGTNAIICDTRSGFRFCYGPNSATQHHEQAIAIGSMFNCVRLKGMSCDIDCPGDLLSLDQQSQLATSKETIRYLQSSGILQRIKNLKTTATPT